jgi:tetratricopeptide (TPR) repeat protein
LASQTESTSGGLSRLCGWLLRPYLDLGPAQTGPLHARAVEEGWLAFTDTARPRFVPQRALPPGFRVLLAQEVGDAYDLSDPRDLAPALRTERWEQLCESLHNWDGLSPEQQVRLATLLHSLCFYDVLMQILQPCSAVDSTHSAELAFWGASAAYMADLPERTSTYVHADTSVFERIALHAGNASRTRFNATAMVFVHKAKTRAQPNELKEWHARFEGALSAVASEADAFSAALYRSRFYRGSAFLPQRLGDKREVCRIMDLAEQHAFEQLPQTPTEQHLHLENLHALMESRTKEALWLGDAELALARARKVVEVDPADAKAWMELGEMRSRRKEWREAAQAYATAALLGPPASAAGRHMAGYSLREAGEERLAALFFKDAVEIDPLGASSLHQIHKLSEDAVHDTLKRWARATAGL